MPRPFSADQVLSLAPRCHPAYRLALAQGWAALERFAIADSPLRMSHFFAQVLHETGALTLLFEDLDYSAARLAVVWPTRFRPGGPLKPAPYAHDARKLANAVYGARMGNTEADDGYVFRGRGLLQLTGKDSYAHAATTLSGWTPAPPDFAGNPDAVLAPEWCLAVAAAFWFERGCNAAADADSVAQVAQCINGGLVGLSARQAWYARTRALFS